NFCVSWRGCYQLMQGLARKIFHFSKIHIQILSFPRSVWERTSGRSASRLGAAWEQAATRMAEHRCFGVAATECALEHGGRRDGHDEGHSDARFPLRQHVRARGNLVVHCGRFVSEPEA